LFPELERDTRERVDFGLAQQRDGAIYFRAEFNNMPAVDGQAGTILRALREHQMTADAQFLKRNWPNIKKAVEWLVAQDGNGDGLITCGQPNTLDADWYGPISWISSLYVAALKAGAEMAGEMGDTATAAKNSASGDSFSSVADSVSEPANWMRGVTSAGRDAPFAAEPSWTPSADHM
jgi:non-lysosomal glucosylceramidase